MILSNNKRKETRKMSYITEIIQGSITMAVITVITFSRIFISIIKSSRS